MALNAYRVTLFSVHSQLDFFQFLMKINIFGTATLYNSIAFFAHVKYKQWSGVKGNKVTRHKGGGGGIGLRKGMKASEEEEWGGD